MPQIEIWISGWMKISFSLNNNIKAQLVKTESSN